MNKESLALKASSGLHFSTIINIRKPESFLSTDYVFSDDLIIFATKRDETKKDEFYALSIPNRSIRVHAFCENFEPTQDLFNAALILDNDQSYINFLFIIRKLIKNNYPGMYLSRTGEEVVRSLDKEEVLHMLRSSYPIDIYGEMIK